MNEIHITEPHILHLHSTPPICRVASLYYTENTDSTTEQTLFAAIVSQTPRMLSMSELESSFHSKYGVLLLILLGFTIVATTRLVQNKYTNHLNDLPGPMLAGYTDIWRTFTTWKGDAHETHRDLHRKYGKVVRLGPNTVSISDPAAIKLIYAVGTAFKKVNLYLISSKVEMGTGRIMLTALLV